MRGKCSINGCEYNEITVKIHEDFEWAATNSNINICWGCGDKLLEAMEKESDTTHLVEHTSFSSSTTITSVIE